MIDLKDLIRPPVLLAVAGSAALGFAAGYLLGRDPQVLRRVMAAAARGWEQTRLSVAELREDLADRWAEATETARHDIEDEAFAAAETVQAAAAGDQSGRQDEARAGQMPKPKRRAPTAAARRRPRAGRTTH